MPASAQAQVQLAIPIVLVSIAQLQFSLALKSSCFLAFIFPLNVRKCPLMCFSLSTSGLVSAILMSVVSRLSQNP